MAAPYSLDLRRKVLQACDDDTIRSGQIVWQQDQEREQRKTRYADCDTTYKGSICFPCNK